MNNQQTNDSEFILTFTIEGTQYENVELKVTDMDKSLKEQVNKIIEVFHLPKTNDVGLPIQYKLGQTKGSDEDPIIFDLEDETGREKCLRDFDIKPGDHLRLIKEPIAG